MKNPGLTGVEEAEEAEEATGGGGDTLGGASSAGTSGEAKAWYVVPRQIGGQGCTSRGAV